MTQATDVRRWSPDDLRRRLDAGEPLAVLDVREDDERLLCAIALPPGVPDIHVPIGEIPDRVAPLRQALGDLPLVIYCHHGVRSLATARWLIDRGFGEVANLEGGIDAWSLAVNPEVPRY